MDTERDKHLLNLIAEGSQHAFNQFYQHYVSFVLQIAVNVIGDPKEAEDVCHDVFIEVYQKPNQYNAHRGSVKAWLAVKTRSRCIDRLRKNEPILVNKLEKLDTEQAVLLEKHVLMDIEKEIIFNALNKLPNKQKELIIGAYFEGKTQRELAETYNKPLGTIKSSIRYGLRALRKQKSLLQWAKADRE
ncbi:RNA polymerase sigma factor [Ornithinibacillus halotolerans]|uniref:DNA-directed RNA polymerase sigma-70 factor n=1 Tax=Ornithinibacillus halotolerans TaxID=1274357 RepID=A0A916RW58_9BACI|nr:sigma-70 family RNA polymerase sigma factor [Ornithinibacillus halotolerans]GGA73187.1 DNA-directed RNA polymerase sigma-70 factor [Ornithinibacillus halotolerans]